MGRARTNAWLERATGIEPRRWFGRQALPLSYARMYLVERDCAVVTDIKSNQVV